MALYVSPCWQGSPVTSSRMTTESTYSCTLLNKRNLVLVREYMNDHSHFIVGQDAATSCFTSGMFLTIIYGFGIS